jgi:hypothetical protein
MASILDDVRLGGTLTCAEDAISEQLRTSILKQSANVVFPIPWAALRVWDAYGTNLPATAATDDLALVGGTFGTAPPMIQAGDLKAAGATSRYARFQVALPGHYEAGETVSLVLSAGMLTTVADTSCTVDVVAYRADKIGGIGSDICATSAQSINSLTFASKTFSITATTLSAGDILDVRIVIACNDAATATAVTPAIAGLDLVCDIR